MRRRNCPFTEYETRNLVSALRAGNNTQKVKLLLANKTALDLRDRKIGNCEVGVLATFLRSSSLTELILSDNRITLEGAQALANVIPFTSLKILSLANNQLGDEGAAAFAKALKRSYLTSLDLSCNNIGEKGAKDLEKALRQNRFLTTLALFDNKIDIVLQNKINSHLIRNRNQVGSPMVDTEHPADFRTPEGELSTVMFFRQSVPPIQENDPSSSPETEFLYAVWMNDIRAINRLIAHQQVDPKEIKDRYGNNALHIAVWCNNMDVLERLASTIGVNSENREGKTPMDIASELHNQDMLGFLKLKGSTKNEENRKKKDVRL